MAQRQQETEFLEHQRQQMVKDWERRHQELAASSLQQIQAAQNAAANGRLPPASVTRFVQSLSSKGKAKVSYEQEYLFEDDLMDDDEEPDVRRS